VVVSLAMGVEDLDVEEESDAIVTKASYLPFWHGFLCYTDLGNDYILKLFPPGRTVFFPHDSSTFETAASNEPL
jgi:hypothetical protein